MQTLKSCQFLVASFSYVLLRLNHCHVSKYAAPVAGAKRQVRLFNRFRIESVLKIAPYHTLKFGGIGKLQYLCIVVRRKAALDKA